MQLFAHHQETIERFVAKIKQDPEVQAVLLGGSIAHGYANESSDVDVMLVVDEKIRLQREKEGRLSYWENESCTYPDGYIDGKFISTSFIRQVAERGSEPARFAFADARPVYYTIEGLEEEVRLASRYPVEQKESNMESFVAQLEGWKWYCGEALKRDNLYLLQVAATRVALFGGRLILAHNERLYPYHKWFLKELERASDRPENMLDKLQLMLREPTSSNIESFADLILHYRSWPGGSPWPNRFMLDSELTWLEGWTPVDDR